MTYMETNLKILRMFTFYPLKETASKGRVVFFKVFKNVYFYGLVLMSVQGIIDLLETDFNFVDHGYKLLNLFIFLSAVYNVGYFHLRRKKLCQMVKTMNANFKYRSEGLEDQDMSKTVRRLSIVTYIWTTVVTVAGLVMSSSTMFSGTERVLPIPAWYPYNWTASPVFELTMLHQVVVNIFMCTSFCNSDLLVFALCYTTAAQFKILGTNFRNIVYTTLLEHGCSKSEVVAFAEGFNGTKNRNNISNMDLLMEDKTYQDKLQKRLASYVDHHIKLVDFCREIESFCYPILLLKLQSVTIFIIVMLYTVATNDDLSFVAAVGGYLFTVVIELVFYTSSGEMLHGTVEKFLDSLYQCPWYVCNRRFQKDIYLILICGARPIKLTAGKLINLRLVAFTTVLRTAFSFYTVLKRTMDK
ncbi:Odorant receptor Or113 [Rhyzopertha dominica]|nr:Odorant receptor Or113 [Rhyzopertha dominica]